MVQLSNLIDMEKYLYQPISDPVLHEIKFHCIEAVKDLIRSDRIRFCPELHSITLDADIDEDLVALLPWACDEIPASDAMPWSVYRGREAACTVYFQGEQEMVQRNTIVLGVRVQKEEYREPPMNRSIMDDLKAGEDAWDGDCE